MPNPVPYRVDDGNFETGDGESGNQCGTPFLWHPFARHGDNYTFCYSVPMKCDSRSYVAPISMQQRNFDLGLGYLVDVTTADADSELLEYDEIYACLPASRIEYGSASGSVTTFVGTPDFETGEGIINQSDVFDCSFLYEYSLFTPLPTQFPYRYGPPPFVRYGSGVNGYSPTLTDPDTGVVRKLLQSSSSRIWMGKIYERLSIFADVSGYINQLG